jgi:hypothetical protein
MTYLKSKTEEEEEARRTYAPYAKKVEGTTP